LDGRYENAGKHLEKRPFGRPWVEVFVKWIFKKLDTKAWIEFVSFRTGTSFGIM
jgi:hypothetical protein